MNVTKIDKNLDNAKSKQRGLVLLRLWFYKIFVKEKLNNFFGYLLFSLISIFIGAVIYKGGVLPGIVGIVIIIGIPFLVLSLFNLQFSILFAITISFFVFFIKRITYDDFPVGVLIELILFIGLFGIFLNQISNRNRSWKFADSEITYAFLLFFLFILIQGLNPNSSSSSGYLLGVRKALGFLAAYFIALYAIKDLKAITLFTKVWLLLALFTALYGIKQEWLGLTQFEWNQILRTEGNRITAFLSGNIRKFSILSDPTSFGIFMSFSSLVCIILMLGPFSIPKKIMLGMGGLSMLLGMAYSGTRTAYAMIPIGVLIFVLMTITNKNTLIFSIFFVAIGSILIYGPIYGNPTINRIRTVFQPNEDASYKVRDNNRASIQPYIYSHPIGGGISTSGELGLKFEPDHYLAGFPPDSGYLRTAIEIGYLGLILNCYFFFIILKVGIQNFYRTKDPKLKSYNIAYLAFFFSIIVANYSQESIGQIPAALVFYPSMAILVRLKDYRDA